MSCTPSPLEHPLPPHQAWTSHVSVPLKIESAWLDGSKRRTIVDDRIESPSALAVDFQMSPRTLYWADQKMNTIESMLATGKRRHVILQGQREKRSEWFTSLKTHVGLVFLARIWVLVLVLIIWLAAKAIQPNVYLHKQSEAGRGINKSKSTKSSP